MTEIERNKDVSHAIDITKKFIVQSHRRRSRIHDHAREIAFNNFRCLTGLCGSCQHLQLDFRRTDGKEVVGTMCAKGHSPRRLYEDTPLGEVATCPSFEPRQKIS